MNTGNELEVGRTATSCLIHGNYTSLRYRTLHAGMALLFWSGCPTCIRMKGRGYRGSGYTAPEQIEVPHRPNYAFIEVRAGQPDKVSFPDLDELFDANRISKSEYETLQSQTVNGINK